MTKEELRKYFFDLSDKIMKYALTPEQAFSIITYLREKYPYNTDQGKVYGQVMIETGAGESLMMVAQFAEGRKAPEQFAIDFVSQV
jgi:hypothetical protein